MNKKVSLLIVSTVLAIIVFIISVKLQKKLVDYVPTIKCMIVTEDFEQYSQIDQNSIKYVDMPIEIVANTRIVTNYDDIKELFLKDKIYKGQMLLGTQFDTRENLMIFNGEEGKEKISIKVKSPENGASYILKKGSLINVYVTLNSEYANYGALKDYEKYYVGEGDRGYSSFKILSSVKLLGTFNENGEEVDSSSERAIDTILISVSPEEAQTINLIRDFSNFSITEL